MSIDHPEDAAPTLRRLCSGNSRLDEILGGGFPASSINVIMGEPGSGKTIVVEQLVFANARGQDRPILFLTTMSEPLDKVIRYLQQFSFFDPALIGDVVVYESIGEQLTSQGVGCIAELMRDKIVDLNPSIIVIDSFKAMHDLSQGVVEMRTMLFELAGLLTASDSTAFLIGEYDGNDVARFPEFAVADAMIQLTRNKLGDRDERFLRVLKLRGSAYREGQHSFAITGDGLEVFPRLVSPKIPPSYTERSEVRLHTGVAGLDAMLGGGVGIGRSSFVIGPTGSGKTTLGLQFVVAGLRRGEECLHVGLQENPTRLQTAFASLGLHRDDPNAGRLRSVYYAPVELQIDRAVDAIFRAIYEHNISRLVIDAVGDLSASAGGDDRLHAYLYALTQHFVTQGVTTLLLCEATSFEAQRHLSALADNIIAMGTGFDEPEAQRWLRVVKARGCEHDLRRRRLVIDGAGLHIG